MVAAKCVKLGVEPPQDGGTIEDWLRAVDKALDSGIKAAASVTVMNVPPEAPQADLKRGPEPSRPKWRGAVP